MSSIQIIFLILRNVDLMLYIYNYLIDNFRLKQNIDYFIGYFYYVRLLDTLFPIRIIR